uniref:DUF7745 domain-containing protein n=1 Tax=Fagus sylvatica TaxID=28930 RepID=A0A2N9FVW6_FAGSY
MASSSDDLNSLVTLHFHDFRVERMRHWWTLLGEDDQADIVGIFGKFPPLMRLRVNRGLLEALASFWDSTHCYFSIGEVDLIPTLEEYVGLLQLDSPFSETPVIPIQSPRSNRVLEKYLGLTSAVLRPEIVRAEETWRKANISLDLLMKYFFWSDFPVEFAGDFIGGKRGWKKFRINAFKIAFAGIFLFPISAGRIDLGIIPLETGRGGPDVLHTAPSALTVNIALPFTGNNRDWVLYLLDLPLSYYPSLALRQFGSVQYPPRLGDLSTVTFDYIPGEDMWRLLFMVEDIWGGRLSEMVLIEGGLHADSSVTPDFVEWREGWSPSFTLRPTCHNPIFTHGIFSGVGTLFGRQRLRKDSLRPAVTWSASKDLYARGSLQLRRATSGSSRAPPVRPESQSEDDPLSLPDSQQVDPRARARWKEDTFMHDVELSDRQEFTGSSRNPDRKTTLKRTKNTPVASARGTISHKPKLGFPQIWNLAKVGNASFPTTAAFARRVFPTRCKLTCKPGCVGKMTTPATTWNSRFAGSIPRLTGIFAGKAHKNSSSTPTSGSHNSLSKHGNVGVRNEVGATQGLRLALALGHHGMSPLHGGVAEVGFSAGVDTTIWPGASYSSVPRSLRASASTGQSERVAVLERELEEARAELSSLRLARASEREESAARVESMRSTLHHNSVAVANLRCDLEVAKDHMEETLTETQGQLETEQVERTRVQDELDSLRSYTQALVDPSTSRPHDIVAFRRALDESEAALTSARTSMGAMRVQIIVLQGDNGVLQTEVDLVNQVMDSLGARARAVLEEHDEGDPALSTALGRFCGETCIRLGH